MTTTLAFPDFASSNLGRFRHVHTHRTLGPALNPAQQSLHINVDLLLRQSVLTPKLGKC